MKWFKVKKIGYIALIMSMLMLSITGVALASTGQLNFKTFFGDLRSQIESGDITIKEAKAEIKEKIDAGELDPGNFRKIGNRFHGKRSFGPESADGRIKAGLESGAITEEEADAIREKIAANDGKFHKRGHWKPMGHADLEAGLKTKVDSGAITEEEADTIREKIAANGGKFHKWGHWKPMGHADLEAGLKAKVDSGAMIEEEADTIREKIGGKSGKIYQSA